MRAISYCKCYIDVRTVPLPRDTPPVPNRATASDCEGVQRRGETYFNVAIGAPPAKTTLPPDSDGLLARRAFLAQNLSNRMRMALGVDHVYLESIEGDKRKNPSRVLRCVLRSSDELTSGIEKDFRVQHPTKPGETLVKGFKCRAKGGPKEKHIVEMLKYATVIGEHQGEVR